MSGAIISTQLPRRPEAIIEKSEMIIESVGVE
jgi:hypothetical protein